MAFFSFIRLAHAVVLAIVIPGVVRDPEPDRTLVRFLRAAVESSRILVEITYFVRAARKWWYCVRPSALTLCVAGRFGAQASASIQSVRQYNGPRRYTHPPAS